MFRCKPSIHPSCNKCHKACRRCRTRPVHSPGPSSPHPLRLPGPCHILYSHHELGLLRSEACRRIHARLSAICSSPTRKSPSMSVKSLGQTPSFSSRLPTLLVAHTFTLNGETLSCNISSCVIFVVHFTNSHAPDGIPPTPSHPQNPCRPNAGQGRFSCRLLLSQKYSRHRLRLLSLLVK